MLPNSIPFGGLGNASKPINLSTHPPALHFSFSQPHGPRDEVPISLTLGKPSHRRDTFGNLTLHQLCPSASAAQQASCKSKRKACTSPGGGVFPVTVAVPSLTVAAQPSKRPKTFRPLPHMPVSKSKHFKRLGELRPRKKQAGRECFSKFGKAFQVCGAGSHWWLRPSVSCSPGVQPPAVPGLADTKP